MRTLYKLLLGALLLIACGSTITYQAIRHDGTLTGDGITGSPLGVNRGTAITTSSIATDKDDFAPTGWDDASVVRLDAGGFYGISGFAAPSASDKPQSKLLINISTTNSLFFPQDHPDSGAANRFTGHPGDFILLPGKSCMIYYDGTSSRWRIEGEQNFVSANSLTYSWSAGSVTGADYGDIGILAINSGTHAATASTTSLPGADQISTITASNAGGGVTFVKGALTFTSFGNAHNYTECYISIPTLSDGTETFTVELQITSSPSSSSLEPNNTLGIRYSHGINGGEWEVFNQDNAAAESTLDANVAVATNTLYKLSLWTDKANTETRAYINGVFVGRITGSRPSAVVCGARVLIIKSAGTTARTLNIHSFSAGAIYN